MQVFFKESLLIFSGNPEVLAAFTKSFSMALYFPRELLEYQIFEPGVRVWLIAKKKMTSPALGTTVGFCGLRDWIVCSLVRNFAMSRFGASFTQEFSAIFWVSVKGNIVSS